MTRHTPALAVILLLALSLTGCLGRRAPTGFRLPPGNAAAGQATFVELKCNGCHTVKDVDLPAPSVSTVVELGGQVRLPRTDGEITTDIIMPSSHFAPGYPADQIETGGKSNMPDYTTRMTIRQLADVVAFLQAH